MAIVGTHLLLYTPEAEALRTVLRETFGFDFVESNDPPDGWQIFALPPSEVGIHPSNGSTRHQICFMCDDLAATMDELGSKGIEFCEVQSDPWGDNVLMLLPGGVEVLLYEPKHQTAV